MKVGDIAMHLLEAIESGERRITADLPAPLQPDAPSPVAGD